MGEGARVTSDGAGLVSIDGTRVYRPPADKNSPFAPTGKQANFELFTVDSKTGGKTQVGNGQLNIAD